MDYDIKIKAFKAIDNVPLCEEYSKHYEIVLASYGINSAAMSDTGWHTNPNIYVITAEDRKKKKIIGGTRIELKSSIHPLPIEEAIGKEDPRIFNFIELSEGRKTGEICRLWNLRDISGSGLSSIILLSSMAEVGIVVAEQLELTSLIELCSPWTVNMFKKMGFTCLTDVGKQGTFVYPRPGLEATVMYLNDIKKLKSAAKTEKEEIMSLRTNPKQVRTKQGIMKNLKIEYDLLIESEQEYEI